jgi:hypothetical protein
MTRLCVTRDQANQSERYIHMLLRQRDTFLYRINIEFASSGSWGLGAPYSVVFGSSNQSLLLALETLDGLNRDVE